TNVTTSPTASRRSSSATWATAATSGPRAENSVTISSTPTSWPISTPASTSPTGPPADDPDGPGTSTGGGSSTPEYQRSSGSRPRPSASDRSMTAKRMAGSSHRSEASANDGYI